MIKIAEVQMKKAKNGNDYKNLKLEDGRYVNMWGDDPDYTIAEAGIELDRDLQQNGQYWNLLPAGERATQPKTQQGDLAGKVEAIYYTMQEYIKNYEKNMAKIMEKLELEFEPFERLNDSTVDADDDINPEDIPF